MTSKLKCPFCKEEIISDFCLMCDKIDKGYTSGRQIYKCNKCGLFGNKELWQELIRTRNALEEIKKHNKAMLSVLGEQIPKESTDTEEYCWWASCRIQDCLKALELIEHKEEK